MRHNIFLTFSWTDFMWLCSIVLFPKNSIKLLCSYWFHKTIMHYYIGPDWPNFLLIKVQTSGLTKQLFYTKYAFIFKQRISHDTTYTRFDETICPCLISYTKCILRHFWSICHVVNPHDISFYVDLIILFQSIKFSKKFANFFTSTHLLALVNTK